VTITGLTEARYFLRVSAIYRTTSLTITGTDAAGPIQFNGSQAKIDVTGKARDVLRRIVVAVDLTDANTRSVPDAAINSGDSICKRFRVTPGYFEVPEDYDGAGGNTLCEAQTSGTVQAVAVSGRADFETCNGGCGGGSGPPVAPVISWYGTFLNTSDNDPNDVKSCAWDFDDAKYGGTNSIATTSCYYGDKITHLFYPNNYPGPYTQCRLYNVKLSVTLNDGTVKTKQITIRMPGGTSSTCLTFV
jgi:hypothetical protein